MDLPLPPILAPPAFDHDTAKPPASPPPETKTQTHSPPDIEPLIIADSPGQLLPLAAEPRGHHTAVALLTLAPPTAVPTSVFPEASPYTSMAVEPTNTQDQPMLSGEYDMSSYTGFDDFDAPFDISSAVPLPPLFDTLFSQSFPPLNPSTPSRGGAFSFDNMHNGAAGSSQRDGDESGGDNDDLCPLDDADPVLPFGRIPCDKPECDFTTMSCALPIPWRPPTLEVDIRSRDVWVAQVAWAKLVSHPRFGECDLDELCNELRDRTRCSEDGRVVISKAEACDVFRSIPERARAARERAGM